MYLKEAGLKALDWIQLAADPIRWRDLVNIGHPAP
jgi:hypothetical protein